MEGIDYNNLTICEAYHLSKAQRYVSSEPWPTSTKPLDRVFIDTVGKVTKAINSHQYAVILTDAKTQMRWAINTQIKSQITQLKISWIKLQRFQYNKLVHTIFRDGASEFHRIKEYFLQHGIQTDVSAPDTPEQNGASKAANEITQRRAQSMLIDANMPPPFWLWTVEHACFLKNRLYNPCTKKKSTSH